MAPSARGTFGAKVVLRGWIVCVIALGLLGPVTFGGKPSRGNVCVTEDGGRGRCVPVKQCASILSTLRKGAHTNEDSWHVYGNECGRMPDGKALVCCLQAPTQPAAGESVPNLSTDISPNEEDTTPRIPDKVYLPQASTSDPVCGVQPSARAVEVEGSSQSVGFHPWDVLLHYGNRTFHTEFSCSGTLISSQYVLTSAGCVDDDTMWPILTARLGEYDLESSVDCIFVSDDDDLLCANPSYDVLVAEVFVHEDAGNHRNDIALLKLSQPVELNEWVLPLCLPELQTLNETAIYQTASWNNNTCENTINRHKLITSHTITNRTACWRHLPPGTQDDFVCVAPAGQPFVTRGGSLTVPKLIPNDRGTRTVHELVGSLSSASTCANYDGVFVYTKMGPHMKWIRSKLDRSN